MSIAIIVILLSYFIVTISIACLCVHAKSFQSYWTLWTVAHQAPLSMGFSRQEYWSGLSFPSPGDLPNPGIKPSSHLLDWQAGSLLPAPPGKPTIIIIICYYNVTASSCDKLQCWSRLLQPQQSSLLWRTADFTLVNCLPTTPQHCLPSSKLQKADLWGRSSWDRGCS